MRVLLQSFMNIWTEITADTDFRGEFLKQQLFPVCILPEGFADFFTGSCKAENGRGSFGAAAEIAFLSAAEHSSGNTDLLTNKQESK